MNLNRREAIFSAMAILACPVSKEAAAKELSWMPFINGPCEGAFAYSVDGCFERVRRIRKSWGSGRADLYILTDNGYSWAGVVACDTSEP